jgi:N-acyl-D-amino-acid deacylase
MAVLGLVTVLISCNDAPPAYDLLILDGSIIDGSGSPAYEGDIAIVGDKIARIGDLDGVEASRVIDAGGLTVSPGFIDLHNHGDRNIRDNPGVENFLFQGVTTLLTGNCGNSPVHLDEYFKSVGQTRIALNLGILIGHNAVREAVMGNDDRAPTAQEQVQMEGLAPARSVFLPGSSIYRAPTPKQMRLLPLPAWRPMRVVSMRATSGMNSAR